MVDEETSLIAGGSPARKKIRKKFNIEILRIMGLCGMIAMLIAGNVISWLFVNFPEKENPSSWQDKLFLRSPSDFDKTQTYIHMLFHFNHTCSVIDFEPAKSICAMILMFYEIPTLLFTILSYYRTQFEQDPKFDTLKTVNKILTPIQFFMTLYVYMVSVNPPNLPPDTFGTYEADWLYFKHYLPFMGYQFSMLFMGIQQTWYICLTEAVPYQWVSVDVMRWYLKFFIGLTIYYTVFIWSFMPLVPPYTPILDTTVPMEKIFAQVLMYLWLAMAVVIPLIFSFGELKTTPKSAISFSMIE
jgi:hypothetical protein